MKTLYFTVPYMTFIPVTATVLRSVFEDSIAYIVAENWTPARSVIDRKLVLLDQLRLISDFEPHWVTRSF